MGIRYWFCVSILLPNNSLFIGRVKILPVFWALQRKQTNHCHSKAWAELDILWWVVEMHSAESPWSNTTALLIPESRVCLLRLWALPAVSVLVFPCISSHSSYCKDEARRVSFIWSPRGAGPAFAQGNWGMKHASTLGTSAVGKGG